MSRGLIAHGTDCKIECEGFEERDNGLELWAKEDGDTETVGYITFERLLYVAEV
jgi:hypothetical protein